MTSGAAAQNISNEVMARDSTLAYGVGLKTWDSVKLYGAEKVEERDRKPWLPDGMRIGNFWVFAGVNASTLYDNNVLATSTNPKSDTIFLLDPSFRIFSDIPRHSFDFSFGGRFAKYMENESYDHFDVNAALNGSFQVTHADQLAFTLRSGLDHMDRINPDEPKNARESTPYVHNRAAVSLKHDAGRLWGSVGASYDDWTFQNVQAFDGSTIDQSGRDQRIIASHLITGYRFSPGYDLIMKGRVLRQDNPTVANTGTDAFGYDGAFGLKAEINPLVRWHLFGGWGAREYDLAGKGTTSALIGEAGITWLPTQVMTVNLLARRDISDGSVVAGTAGRIDNLLRARIEYEALRNLVFTIQGDYRQLEYDGTTRSDQLYVGQVALNYLHSKNTALTLSYEHQHRLSNVESENVSRDRIMLTGKLRF